MVKIAPGERAAYWDECRENGYICIGWDELGDLSRFACEEEFRKAFDDQFSAEYHGNKSKLSVKANEVWTFRELEPGDTVIANRGTSQVVGIGTVIEPGTYGARSARSTSTPSRCGGPTPPSERWTHR